MIRELKKWVAAALLGLVAVSSAQARNITVATPVDTQSFAAIVAHGAGNFTDNISFGLSAPSSFASLIASFNVAPLLGLKDLSFQLFSGATALSPLISAVTSPGSAIFPGIHATHSTLLASFPLMAGNYTAVVKGAGIGLGGIYTVGMFAVAAPVPEPSEWMMLVAGLMVMGFIAKRRSNALS